MDWKLTGYTEGSPQCIKLFVLFPAYYFLRGFSFGATISEPPS